MAWHRAITAALFSLLSAATTASAQNTFPLSGGNVGIGTTAPPDALTIISPAAGGAHLSVGYGVTERYKIGRDDVTGYLVIDTTNSTTKGVVFKGGGNVGIGTTQPAAKLHVAGDAQVDGNI